MTKFSKVIIVLFILSIIALIITFFITNNGGSQISKEFDQGEEADIDRTYETYPIGNETMGYLRPSCKFELKSSDDAHLLYQHDNSYIEFINLNSPVSEIQGLDPGTVDIYTRGQIKDLPSKLNEQSRLVLNNLYNKGYLVEKYLVNSDMHGILISGDDKEGTLGHQLKMTVDPNSEYTPFYCLFSNNILIITLDNQDNVPDDLGAYSRTEKGD